MQNVRFYSLFVQLPGHFVQSRVCAAVFMRTSVDKQNVHDFPPLNSFPADSFSVRHGMSRPAEYSVDCCLE